MARRTGECETCGADLVPVWRPLGDRRCAMIGCVICSPDLERREVRTLAPIDRPGVR